MARKILVIGETGSGKSTSLKNLKPEETFIIGAVKKDLPFRGWKKKYTVMNKANPNGNYVSGKNYYTEIIQFMRYVSNNRPDIKTLVIDDVQYIMGIEFINRASEKGFDKFTELAQHIIYVFMEADKLRDDLNIIFLTHSENKGNEAYPLYKAKTIGKLVDEKFTLEGLFTFVLFTNVREIDKDSGKFAYEFLTNTDGEKVAKTPDGIFSDMYIPNDLDLVIRAIDAYDNGDDFDLATEIEKLNK